MRRLPRGAAEDVAWLGVLPAVAIALVGFHWLAAPFGNHFLAPPVSDHFAEWNVIFRPEPVEEARFLIAIALPVVLAGAVVLFGTARARNRRWDPLVIAIQLAGLGFAIWALTKQTRDGWLYPHEYQPLVLSVPNLVAGVAIGAILTALAVRPPAVSVPERTRTLAARLRGWPAIPTAIAVVVTALWLLPAIFTDTTVGHPGLITPGHIPFQFEDYLAVVNGRTPLVNFVPDYASLLPLAISPILPIFNLSITSFSVIECLLSLLAMIAIYAAIAHVTEGRWSALALYVPYVAISFFPWTVVGNARDFNGVYYATFPNRYLGPFAVIWLCARTLRRGSPPLWVVFFVAGLTLLNNFEFGLPCLAALAVAVAASVDRSEPIASAGKTMIVQAAAGLAGALVLVSAITLIRAGALPDPGILTYWSRVFGRAGYGLLPMPTYGLHWALYLTYAGTLALAAVRFARAEPDRTLTALLAFSGIFGLATGQYFAGRSQPADLILLFPVWGFCIALLTWVTFLAVRDGRNSGGLPRRSLVSIFAVLTAFGLMISTVDRFPLPWSQVDRLSDTGPAIYNLDGEQAFIESRTDPGESVLVIGMPFDHRVAERAGVRNVSPWDGGTGSLLSPREVLRARTNLVDEGGTKLFEINNTHSVEIFLPQVGFRRIGRDPRTGLREWILQ